MSTPRKARSDAHLKTLPPERQEDIVEYARDHSLKDTKAWLAGDGVVTSAGALSEFLSWWALRDRLTRNESTVETVLEQLKQTRPDLTEDDLFNAGQAFFSALAIEQMDPKAWKGTQDLRFKQQEVRLEREKYQRDLTEKFLEWFEDRQAREIAENTALSRKEKIEAIGQKMFGELW